MADGTDGFYGLLQMLQKPLKASVALGDFVLTLTIRNCSGEEPFYSSQETKTFFFFFLIFSH